jgi:AcrR family transcriptional regulator
MVQSRTTRDALLDAAYDVAVAGNWQTARILDVATAAGVSRQTLYNEFGSKDALAQALAMREAQRFIDGTNRFLDEIHPDAPVDAVAAATQWTIREASNNPLLKAVLTDDAGGLLPYLTTRAEALHAAAAERCASQLLGLWPQLPVDDVRLVADVVTRLTVSHIVLPGARPEQVADDVARLVDRLLPVPPRQENPA